MNAFLATFRRLLLAQLASDPSNHRAALRDKTPEQLADVYCGVIQNNGVKALQLDSPTYKAVCKTLGIKHTYKAMQQYIDNHA